MPVYLDYLIHDFIERYGGQLVSVREIELRQIIERAIAQEREACAAHLEQRAADIEAGSSYAAQWMARIYRDEADLIRAR